MYKIWFRFDAHLAYHVYKSGRKTSIIIIRFDAFYDVDSFWSEKYYKNIPVILWLVLIQRSIVMSLPYNTDCKNQYAPIELITILNYIALCQESNV